jgi:hypothetical protein
VATDKEARLDDLYSAPLAEFTALRNDLAKELGSEGRDDEAAEIKKLKKPPVTAWATNLLAKEARPKLEKLIAASEDLERGLSEGDNQLVTQATAARRKALAGLRHEAEKILEKGGHNAGAGPLERIVRNLQFAATGAGTREDLLRGRLSSDVEPSGLEAAFGSVGEDAAERKTQELKRDRRRKELEAELGAAEEFLAGTRKAAKEAEAAATAARKRVEQAEIDVAKLTRRIDSLD